MDTSLVFRIRISYLYTPPLCVDPILHHYHGHGSRVFGGTCLTITIRYSLRTSRRSRDPYSCTCTCLDVTETSVQLGSRDTVDSTTGFVSVFVSLEPGFLVPCSIEWYHHREHILRTQIRRNEVFV